MRMQASRCPHDYLLHCRMMHAADLLLDGTRQIKEVALILGHDDPGQFRKVFKNHPHNLRLRLNFRPRLYLNPNVLCLRNKSKR